MPNSRIIDLTGRVRSFGPLRFLRAEVVEQTGSQFATVYYSIDKREQPLGLRLDLSKRSFLDVTNVPPVDAQLADIASLIADVTAAKAGLQLGRSQRPVDLQEQFELDGVFWLPHDEAIQSEGTLKYSPGDKITLTLLRELRPNDKFSPLLESENYPVINAQFVDGSVATLIDCFVSKWSLRPGGRSKTEILVNRCVLNAHAPEADALKFASCRVRLTSLEEWLSTHFVNVDWGGSPNKEFSSLKVKYDRPVPIMLKLPSEDCELIIHSGLGFTQSSTAFTMERIVTLQCNYGRKKPLDDWLDVAWSLQLLFSLFVGEAVAIREELLEVSTDDTSSVETVLCPLVAVQRVHKTTKHVSSTEMLLSWVEVEPMATEVFDKWLQLLKKARQAIAVFFETMFAPETANHLKFLSIVTAMEIYFGATAGVLGADVKAMTELLLALSSRLPIETQRAIVGDAPKFFEQVVLTRNYFVHGRLTGETKAMDGASLHYATEKLKVLFIAVLLAEIGVPKSQVLYILRKKPWMRWAMNISLD